MWAVLIVSAVQHWRYRDADRVGCPECGHEAGLDARHTQCPEVDDYSGWVSDRCDCRNVYHWTPGGHSPAGVPK